MSGSDERKEGQKLSWNQRKERREEGGSVPEVPSGFSTSFERGGPGRMHRGHEKGGVYVEMQKWGKY